VAPMAELVSTNILDDDGQHTEMYRRAADLIGAADGLLIAAGAGMGVDSGLPDFRGPAGFWAAYPALGRARLQFSDIANMGAFTDDPVLAWGFYGHRLQLYRSTAPHAGYGLLDSIGKLPERGAFVFTSNVDGAFYKSGFPSDRVAECHGSIHHLQCLENCSDAIWSANDFIPEVDQEECRLLNALPLCPQCGAVARPNILMFSDWLWLAHRTELQQERLYNWLEKIERLAVIEIGAGTAIPTVRRFAKSLGRGVIRINPLPDGGASPGDIFLKTTALKGIQGIARELPGN
jgi:NAD-dependent SIR2 family protein deacetylase